MHEELFATNFQGKTEMAIAYCQKSKALYLLHKSNAIFVSITQNANHLVGKVILSVNNLDHTN